MIILVIKSWHFSLSLAVACCYSITGTSGIRLPKKEGYICNWLVRSSRWVSSGQEGFDLVLRGASKSVDPSLGVNTFEQKFVGPLNEWVVIGESMEQRGPPQAPNHSATFSVRKSGTHFFDSGVIASKAQFVHLSKKWKEIKK